MELVTDSRYLNFKHAMQYLDITSYSTLDKYIKAGLPVVFVANSRRIDKQDLDTFMRNKKI